MKANPLLALVGSSGVGKTTLMFEAMKIVPDKLFPIRAHTNRARRGVEDDVFCKFVDAEAIRAMNRAGELVQYLEYGGNVYGTTMADVEWANKRGIGANAFVETGITDLRKAGFEVIPLKIISDCEIIRDEVRRLADLARVSLPVDFQSTIHNSFKVGGLQKSVAELVNLVEGLLKD